MESRKQMIEQTDGENVSGRRQGRSSGEVRKKLSMDLEYLIRSSQSTDGEEMEGGEDDEIDEKGVEHEDDETNRSIGEDIEDFSSSVLMETHLNDQFQSHGVLLPLHALTQDDPQSGYLHHRPQSQLNLLAHRQHSHRAHSHGPHSHPDLHKHKSHSHHHKSHSIIT